MGKLLRQQIQAEVNRREWQGREEEYRSIVEDIFGELDKKFEELLKYFRDFDELFMYMGDDDRFIARRLGFIVRRKDDGIECYLSIPNFKKRSKRLTPAQEKLLELVKSFLYILKLKKRSKHLTPAQKKLLEFNKKLEKAREERKNVLLQ